MNELKSVVCQGIRLHIPFDESELMRIEAIARTADVTVEDVVIRAVNQYLKNTEDRIWAEAAQLIDRMREERSTLGLTARQVHELSEALDELGTT